MTTTLDGDPRPEKNEHEHEHEHWARSEWAEQAMTYLVRLKSYLGKQERTGASISVPVAGDRFLVSPKEREIIRVIDDPESEPVGEQNDLIRHSIGMQVKLMADIRHYNTCDQKGRSSAQRRLDAGIKYGDLCAYEMHRLVSRLSKDGDLEGGKQMAEYRRRLVAMLEKAGKAAGAKSEAPDIECVTRPDYDPKAAARAKAKVLGKKKEKKRDLSIQRKNIYVIASVVLFALTAVIVFRLWSGRERMLERVDVDDFRSIPGVEQVICRPPGIIVIVSDASWNVSSAQEKQNAIRIVVNRVESKGYRRAEVRSPTKQRLALWFKGEDPEVVSE